MGTTDWRDWHQRYDDPESSLARRLAVVRQQLGDVLATSRVRRILGLCAGDGRDVVPVLADLAPADRPETVLVELDPVLATAAERRASDAGVAMTVLVGDAASPSTWSHALPVDVLMLCGIFGNISDGDIRSTIGVVPAFLAQQGTVVWTRGAFGSRDLRPHIRQWFGEAGFDEVAYLQEDDGYGVGVHRVTDAAVPGRLPERLFSFVR